MGCEGQTIPVNARVMVMTAKNPASSQKPTTATLRTMPGLPGFHVFAAMIAASEATVRSPVVMLSPAIRNALPSPREWSSCG